MRTIGYFSLSWRRGGAQQRDNARMSRSTEVQGGSIAAVEQATGIARATLRIWERRYGFPQPDRDARGERIYPQEQVDKLRLVAELMHRGLRPGRLVAMSAAELEAVAVPSVRSPAARGAPVDDPVLPLLRRHDGAAVTRLLEEAMRGAGLAAFVTERLAAMNVNVGLAWARGELQVFEEHLYAEAVQGVLRARLAHQRAAASQSQSHPRVLLATFPDELHGLGLLMAEAMLAEAGCQVLSLGTRVPLQQIAAAARAFRADVVGLSFCASMNPTHVVRGLEQLRGELEAEVAIWAGGSSPVLARHRIEGVRPVPHIGEVHALVAAWREEREAVA